MKLYEYVGTLSGYTTRKTPSGITEMKMILWQALNDDKAPIGLVARGKIADYINEIEGTDAEERYIDSTWVYDSSLTLRRIEVPGSLAVPAKVIATTNYDTFEELEIFGPKEFIDDPKPESMSREEYGRLCQYESDHWDWWFGRG